MNKISLQNVRKTFNSKVAVAGATFDISEGTVFGLLGPNGAGKTTLIRMIMDILKPDSGAILYEGHALTDADKDRITYLPEERGLYKKESVRSMLEYFARLKGMRQTAARDRVMLYLEKLGMEEEADRKVEELSKGNQQKIQIAVTLVSDPDVIILDEPFTGLDPLNVRLTKTLLAEAREQGKTIVLSTHQMNQVEELCDHLFMINEGNQVLYGGLAEILGQYSESALLLECSPISGSVPGIERIAENGRFVKVYPAQGVEPTEVLRALLDRGIRIEHFQKATTPLEEVFVKVARETSREAV
jgi:ABC-2 type transport system ATP-binding protein